MVFKHVRNEVLGEIAKSIDGCSSDFGSLMVESLRNEDVHDRIRQVFFDLLGTTFTSSSEYQETSVHLVDVLRVDQSNRCLK